MQHLIQDAFICLKEQPNESIVPVVLAIAMFSSSKCVEVLVPNN